VLARKADAIYSVMSGAPSNEIKGEPQSGDVCAADAFMNARAELIQYFIFPDVKYVIVKVQIILLF